MLGFFNQCDCFFPNEIRRKKRKEFIKSAVWVVKHNERSKEVLISKTVFPNEKGSQKRKDFMKGAVWVVGWLNTEREPKKCRRLRTNWKKESNPQCKNKI